MLSIHTPYFNEAIEKRESEKTDERINLIRISTSEEEYDPRALWLAINYCYTGTYDIDADIQVCGLGGTSI